MFIVSADFRADVLVFVNNVCKGGSKQDAHKGIFMPCPLCTVLKKQLPELFLWTEFEFKYTSLVSMTFYTQSIAYYCI